MNYLPELTRSLGRLAAALALALAIGGQAAAAEPLVSADWLKGQLATPNLVVLDIRSAIDGGGIKAYETGHIPGAVHSDYDKAGWRVTRDNVGFVLPSLAQLEKLIGELGIDETSTVVIVPAGVHVTDFGSAARTYWTLKVAGLKNISILDGGFAAWKSAGYPVESGSKPPSPAIATIALDNSLLAQTSDVEAATRAGVTLIDARSQALFTGKEKAPNVTAYGHIPGSVNLDSEIFYDQKSNRLKPKAELAALAKALPDGPAISYCNTGHWAATDWFVLHEILGRKNVKLYDGSMVEWAADANRPVDSSRTKWDDLKRALGLGS